MRSFLTRMWWFVVSKLGDRDSRLRHAAQAVRERSRRMFLERRFETRTQATWACQLGVMQSNSRGESIFEERTGITVNESKSGMLLLLGSSIQPGKWLEVHSDGTGLRSSFSLVEVRWSKLLRKSSEGDLYLVGCRLSFGPSSYWAI